MILKEIAPQLKLFFEIVQIPIFLFYHLSSTSQYFNQITIILLLVLTIVALLLKLVLSLLFNLLQVVDAVSFEDMGLVDLLLNLNSAGYFGIGQTANMV